ncbi:protein FAM65A-like X2 [Biomphalaria pfeifferi]|uniref:Protein FAM65A-like X2 n=1 Tax=Biomphalaria pfeifferi TaxID=112525 RepID=A0AAD8B7Z1_BIOPF|nr:protein FAM65A-like X2 [Biomphalaria pfeifferi]
MYTVRAEWGRSGTCTLGAGSTAVSRHDQEGGWWRDHTGASAEVAAPLEKIRPKRPHRRGDTNNQFSEMYPLRWLWPGHCVSTHKLSPPVIKDDQ